MLFRKTARALMAEIGDLPYASTKVRFMVICAKDYAVKLSSLGICSSVEEALWLCCDRIAVALLLRGAGGVLLEFSFMGHLKKAFRRDMVLFNP